MPIGILTPKHGIAMFQTFRAVDGGVGCVGEVQARDVASFLAQWVILVTKTGTFPLLWPKFIV